MYPKLEIEGLDTNYCGTVLHTKGKEKKPRDEKEKKVTHTVRPDSILGLEKTRGRASRILSNEQ